MFHGVDVPAEQTGTARLEVVHGAEAHRADRARGDVDLQPGVPGILRGGVEDAVEVLLFDAVRIDQYQCADAVAGELFDQGAARAGTADDADAEPAKAVVGAGAESLRDSAAEFGNGGRLSSGRPERQVVAHDVDRGKRVEAASLVHEPGDHAPLFEHDGAAVGSGLGPGVNGRE